MSRWNTFVNAFKGAAPWLPGLNGVGPNAYQFDLNGAERNSRLPTGFTRWPSPVAVINPNTGRAPGGPIMRPDVIGMVSGNMPLLDMFVWQQAFGRKGFGPGVNAPIGSDALTLFPTTVFPQLPKMVPSTGKAQ